MSPITFDFTDGTTTVSTAPWATTNYQFVPKARHSDPSTSHEAAKKMESGNGPLMREIRFVVERIGYPADEFAIAGWVEQRQPGRWKEGSVRSAVSRAPFLKWVDNLGEVPDTKNACRRYVIKDGT